MCVAAATALAKVVVLNTFDSAPENSRWSHELGTVAISLRSMSENFTVYALLVSSGERLREDNITFSLHWKEGVSTYYGANMVTITHYDCRVQG